MFGQRLNRIRKKKGHTAQYMADALSVSLRTYRHYESNHSFPSSDSLVIIADILDVSIDYLLGRDEWLQSHGVFVDEY
ncbi:MAG: helix-turn-helix transcriptional regulator [Firmicutes bacterium]|jgi:transcriptional regulator with XRE-family HTH domain|nr:helix-turn-helix transcriptional regulator [Bacillota bacterium]